MEKKQAAVLAMQEKRVAETFIHNKDYNEAREKLRRAERLFPQLENIQGMINVTNILCASQSLSSKGFTDWYTVLQADSKADESHIAVKYKMLLESLKPIQNSFPGTHSALAVLHDAFSVLSDKKKRFQFDSKSFTKFNVSDHTPVYYDMDSNAEFISMKSKWSSKDFSPGQIWAVYDGLDSLPRRYVIVNDTVSRTEVSATLLEPQPLTDDEKDWVEEKLPFVCGLFRAGRITINFCMSQFSHVIVCDMNKQNASYRIYPQKGEVWAMYNSWHSKWKFCDYKFSQCQIVEVLSDFSDVAELKITSLVEVNDCTTFFQRQLIDGFELMRTIPRKEMLSFSHQIPCFVVPDIESHGFPGGTLHLEPDSLPPRRSS